jgi:phosphomannomutase
LSAARVKFGTDGWRARIGEGFTGEAAGDVALALAGALTGRPGRIALGFDGRAMSAEAAGVAAERLKRAGWRVAVAPGPVSTPMLSRAVARHQFDGGLMITASHNPPEFNGIKLKTREGGSAPEAVMRKAEGLLEGAAQAAGGGAVTTHDFRGEYVAELAGEARDLLDEFEPAAVVIDYMHGAAGGVLAEALAWISTARY